MLQDRTLPLEPLMGSYINWLDSIPYTDDVVVSSTALPTTFSICHMPDPGGLLMLIHLIRDVHTRVTCFSRSSHEAKQALLKYIGVHGTL